MARVFSERAEDSLTVDLVDRTAGELRRLDYQIAASVPDDAALAIAQDPDATPYAEILIWFWARAK